MSSLLWWFVLGVLLGWLIEWVIDWVYWRRRPQTSDMDAQPQRDDAELARLRASLASARADNQRLRAELNAATTLAQERQAKIDEFSERLARLDADDKRLVVDTQAPRATVVRSVDEGDAEAANFSTVQDSREDMASLAPPVAQGAASGPKTNDTQLLQELEAPQPAKRQRDPLIDINGIGPAYERKLFDAGVYTFEDLAAMTPEQVRAIIAPQRWQEIDPASWIAEARQFAQKKAER